MLNHDCNVSGNSNAMYKERTFRTKSIDRNSIIMSVPLTDVHTFVCTIDLRIVETSRRCPKINYIPHHPGHKM